MKINKAGLYKKFTTPFKKKALKKKKKKGVKKSRKKPGTILKNLKNMRILLRGQKQIMKRFIYLKLPYKIGSPFFLVHPF